VNDLDRFHLARDAIRRLPQLGARAHALLRGLDDPLSAHSACIREHGQDMPEIPDWRWPA
jgi:xylulose-5-phosphate/fructose-6-phosphate phosphoketolase